jgi:hypothetical protein
MSFSHLMQASICVTDMEAFDFPNVRDFRVYVFSLCAEMGARRGKYVSGQEGVVVVANIFIHQIFQTSRLLHFPPPSSPHILLPLPSSHHIFSLIYTHHGSRARGFSTDCHSAWTTSSPRKTTQTITLLDTTAEVLVQGNQCKLRKHLPAPPDRPLFVSAPYLLRSYLGRSSMGLIRLV